MLYSPWDPLEIRTAQHATAQEFKRRAALSALNASGGRADSRYRRRSASETFGLPRPSPEPHASLLAHAGVSTAVTQKLMRHSDPKLTERVYTLVDVETLRREVGLLDFKPLLTRLLPDRSETAPQARRSRREPKQKRRDSQRLG